MGRICVFKRCECFLPLRGKMNVCRRIPLWEADERISNWEIIVLAISTWSTWFISEVKRKWIFTQVSYILTLIVFRLVYSSFLLHIKCSILFNEFVVICPKKKTPNHSIIEQTSLEVESNMIIWICIYNRSLLIPSFLSLRVKARVRGADFLSSFKLFGGE